MTNGNAEISGTEFSPIGSAETFGKDGSACDLSVIREKGVSVSRGAAEKPTGSGLATRPKTDEKKETSTEGLTVKRCGKVILNNTDSQQTQLENELDSSDPCTVTSKSDINQWHQSLASDAGILNSMNSASASA